MTRPSTPVLILNPRSGGGKAERFDLVAQCRARNIEPIVFEPDDDLERLATAAVRDGADALGMAGGDGSQAVVAAVAAEHGLPFVCVPAGTRNHFAFDLGSTATTSSARSMPSSPATSVEWTPRPQFGNRGRLDRGELGVLAVTGPPPRGLEEWATPNFRVDSATTVQLGIDGESVSMPPPLLFESDPLALRVRLLSTAVERVRTT